VSDTAEPYGDTQPLPAPPRVARSGDHGLLLFVAALLGLWGLRLAIAQAAHASGASLQVDEAQYWWWSRELHWGYFSKPPVIAGLIAASTALFGNGELGVKALAMACFPLAAGVLFMLGRELAAEGTDANSDPRRSGLWAAALFACSPLAGLLGLAVTTDGPLLLAWALAMWALWRALARGSLKAWWAFGAALGIGMLSKYTMVALVPGAAVLVWQSVSTVDGRRPVAPLVGALALAALLFAPNLAWNAMNDWPSLRHTAAITAQASAAGRNPLASLGEFVGAQWLIFGPLWLLLALLAAWQASRARRSGELHLSSLPGLHSHVPATHFLLWCNVPLLLLGLAQALNAKAQINWIAPAHLGAMLALALWLARPAAQRLQRGALVLAVAQLLLVSALALAPALMQRAAPGQPVPVWLDLWARMRGWGPAFEALRPAVADAGPATVVGTSRTVLAHAAYHWRGLDLKLVAYNPDGGVDSHFELVSRWPPALSENETVWLVTDGEFPAELLAAFSRVDAASEARPGEPARNPLVLKLVRAHGPMQAASAAAQ
jgi:4-amino-4-deoxy-L-arabinose transferase-like glycosyltransferase